MPIRDITSSQMVISPDADAINLVNRVINAAIKENASDIHVEPGREKLIIRIRVDGVLKVAFEAPKEIVQPFVTRIKVLSDLDVTGIPRPQEGNIKYSVKEKDVDLRVSVFPTLYGECVVMRILESIHQYKSFEDLGFSMEQAKIVDENVSKPFGLILVTGPTGSGKSTTLFSFLNKLNEPGKSLTTLEDPIERKLEHVRQTQVNPDIGLTFASGLRYQLRQDIDIIMVGEIRDAETAKIAIQAAITGQLVLATIHTNNAAGAVIRLLDMGIEPFLLTSALKMVTSQRLARINCPHCRREFTPAAELLYKIKAPQGAKFYKTEGCDKCSGRGVVGRFGIHEVLPVTESIKNMVYKNPSDEGINEVAQKEGMVTLRDIALQRAQEGILSIEEVLRITE